MDKPGDAATGVSGGLNAGLGTAPATPGNAGARIEEFGAAALHALATRTTAASRARCRRPVTSRSVDNVRLTADKVPTLNRLEEGPKRPILSTRKQVARVLVERSAGPEGQCLSRPSERGRASPRRQARGVVERRPPQRDYSSVHTSTRSSGMEICGCPNPRVPAGPTAIVPIDRSGGSGALAARQTRPLLLTYVNRPSRTAT